MLMLPRFYCRCSSNGKEEEKEEGHRRGNVYFLKLKMGSLLTENNSVHLESAEFFAFDVTNFFSRRHSVAIIDRDLKAKSSFIDRRFNFANFKNRCDVLQDSTKEPKKKKKKKKKDSAPKDESIEERPAEVQQEHQKTEPSTFEHHDEFDKKLPEASTATGDSEQDEEVFRPASEQSKEARTTQSGSSTPRESDELKGSVSSLLSDEWQPRRSERIFINSSVTTNSSSSPLSPTGKGSEFSYLKKTKRMSITKVVSIT